MTSRVVLPEGLEPSLYRTWAGFLFQLGLREHNLCYKATDGTRTRIWRHHKPLHGQFCHSRSIPGAT